VSILAFLLTAVLVPMLVNEFTDWLPWFAERLVGAAARTLPSAVRPRYTEEWLGELDATPGKLSKLVVAIRIFVRAPATAVIISGVLSFKAITGKSVFDKTVAASALIAFAPLLTALAVTIRITDKGPVFPRQTMIGKDGQPFTCWMFRTMVTDAGALKGQLLVRNGADRALFDVRRYIGVTRVGAWMRRWSLDELPRLLNVLSGDMSLVGPRPALPAEIAEDQDHIRPSLTVKPGLTGLWQLVGRHLSPDEAERLNTRYVENRSLMVDLQILWKTLATINCRYWPY
jgi:lipopolysaccharide/colanic/teichoic acid biosynthesis glycosyltransferase